MASLTHVRSDLTKHKHLGVHHSNRCRSSSWDCRLSGKQHTSTRITESELSRHRKLHIKTAKRSGCEKNGSNASAYEGGVADRRPVVASPVWHSETAIPGKNKLFVVHHRRVHIRRRTHDHQNHGRRKRKICPHRRIRTPMRGVSNDRLCSRHVHENGNSRRTKERRVQRSQPFNVRIQRAREVCMFLSKDSELRTACKKVPFMRFLIELPWYEIDVDHVGLTLA